MRLICSSDIPPPFPRIKYCCNVSYLYFDKNVFRSFSRILEFSSLDSMSTTNVDLQSLRGQPCFRSQFWLGFLSDELYMGFISSIRLTLRLKKPIADTKLRWDLDCCYFISPVSFSKKHLIITVSFLQKCKFTGIFHKVFFCMLTKGYSTLDS